MAVLEYGILANMLAFLSVAAMVPLVVAGAGHMSRRYPDNKAYIMKWLYIMLAWLVFALVVHGAGCVASNPDSAIGYAVIPAGFLAVVVLFVMNNDFSKH